MERDVGLLQHQISDVLGSGQIPKSEPLAQDHRDHTERLFIQALRQDERETWN